MKDYCRTNGLSLIGYSVLFQGAYTRQDRPLPAQYAGPEACERLDVLKAVAAELDVTLNQLVIAWMLHSDPPVLPIIGGSRVEQLAENLAAVRIRLSEEQMARLDSAGNPDIKKAWLR